MDINELRINNLVKYRNSKSIVSYKITAIDGLHSSVMLSGNLAEERCDLSMIVPIPITEEILLQYGFQEMNIDDFDFPYREELDTLQSLYLLVREGIGELWVAFQEDRFHFCSEYNNNILLELEIKGLHNLQNRYYSMFGMELAK